MSEFLSGLSESVNDWKAELRKFETDGQTALVPEIKAWIAEAERILKSHRGRG